MEALTANMPLIVFALVGAVVIACSILVVTMRNPVHSALFLLLTFLAVAVLFVMRQAEFVAAVQILVYAGGVMVLFLFAVMLINVRTLPEERILAQLWKGGLLMGAALLVVFGWVAATGAFHAPVNEPQALRTELAVAGQPATAQEVGNSEAVGMSLYREYLVPFEVASLFLLVAMIGAIVIGKRELSAREEESVPDFIRERVKSEQEVKEALSA